VRDGAGQRIVHLPILILSARTLAEDRTRGFDVGSQSVPDQAVRPGRVPQPDQEPADVHNRANAPAPPARFDIFEFGENHVNFEHVRGDGGGEPVRMTQLEIALLRYFVENEGRVIPRRELLKKVWGLPGPSTRGLPTNSSAFAEDLRTRAGQPAAFPDHPRRGIPLRRSPLSDCAEISCSIPK
jgi:DNA-binding response OmpR family regulator